MWVERTPQEVARWNKASLRQARSHGRGFAIVLLVVIGAWLVWGFPTVHRGVVIDHHVQEKAWWLRLFVGVVLGLPLAWWLSRSEMRKEWAKLTRRTICPRCDIGGDGNAGELCHCGGPFVPQSTMKWVENREGDQAPRPGLEPGTPR